MTDKITVEINSSDRTAIPKKIRENIEIEQGDILFMNLEPGKVKFTNAIEDLLVEFKNYSERKYRGGITRYNIS